MPPKEEGKAKKGAKKAVQETQGMLALMEKTGYSKAEIISLTTAFRKIAGPEERIDMRTFRGIYTKVMHCGAQLADGVFRATDQSGDGLIDLREFLSLCAILQRGTPLDRFKIIFDAWDTDRSGELCPEEVERMLRATITLEEGDAKDKAVHSMMQRAFRRIDGADGSRKDGQISFDEIKACFESDAQSRELITNFLGQNIPSVDDLIQT